MTANGLIRIGELSRRTGVTIDRLRAWERRYGLLEPARSTGGFRLYSPADQRRVRAMQAQLTAGVSAAEAARAVLAGAAGRTGSLPQRREHLTRALTSFDAPRAHALLDEAFADLAGEQAIAEVVFPVLRHIGERWAVADLHVGQEHFASKLLEGRLLALLRADQDAAGPLAVLACAPGELHTLGLIAVGIALRRHGWGVTYLGADTPVIDVRRTAAQVKPTITVLAAVMPAPFTGVVSDLSALAKEGTLAIAGPGAGSALARRVGAHLLDNDPFTATDEIIGNARLF